MLNLRMRSQVCLIGLTLSAALVVGCDSRSGSSVTPAKNTTTDNSVESTPASPTEKPASTAATERAKPAGDDMVASALPDRAKNTTPDNAQEVPVNTAVTQTIAQAGPSTIEIVPASLDLGDIATGDTGTGSVLIRNNGDQEVTIERIKCSCGCTSAKLAPNTVLKPGEETPMEVKLKGGTRAAVLTKTCRLIVQNQQPVIMQVRGNAISFVSSSPGDLDPNVHSDGRLVFSSADGEPFRITSMNPNIITDFPKEPSSTVAINFPYDAWRDGGAQPKVIFYTDHPKCEMVYVGVRRTAADIENIRQKQRDQQRQIGVPIRGGEKKGNPAEDMQQQQGEQLESRIRRGDTDALLNEVAAGSIGVEAVNQTGMSLLAMASKYGQVELMNGLIDAGANIEAPNRNGHTPLMQAAQSKKVEAVRVLLDAGARIDTRDKLNGTAMSMAATYGDPEIVLELIDAGGRVNEVQDLTGFTPLIWASIAGDPEVVPLLIDAGADIEHGDLLEGATPLIHAARTGKIDTVKYLMEAGADVNARDRNGKTPFLSAVNGASSTSEKLAALVELGADPFLKDNRGLSAMDFAERRTDIRGDDVRAYVKSLFETQGE